MMIDKPISLSVADALAVRAVLVDARKTCPWHGSDLGRSGMWQGLPNCESCRPPYRALRAWNAFTAAVDASHE